MRTNKISDNAGPFYNLTHYVLTQTFPGVSQEFLVVQTENEFCRSTRNNYQTEENILHGTWHARDTGKNKLNTPLAFGLTL